MPEFTAALTRKTSLRKMTETFSSEAIEKLLADLESILEEKRQIETAKSYLIDEIKAVMENTGMTLGLLKSLVDKNLPHSTPNALSTPKYEIHLNGETHRWSGRGRTPKAFDVYIKEHGITKDSLPKVPD